MFTPDDGHMLPRGSLTRNPTLTLTLTLYPNPSPNSANPKRVGPNPKCFDQSDVFPLSTCLTLNFEPIISLSAQSRD